MLASKLDQLTEEIETLRNRVESSYRLTFERWLGDYIFLQRYLRINRRKSILYASLLAAPANARRQETPSLLFRS